MPPFCYGLFTVLYPSQGYMLKHINLFALVASQQNKQDKIPLEMGPNPFHPASPEPQNFTVEDVKKSGNSIEPFFL